jgi:hypothetical protein
MSMPILGNEDLRQLEVFINRGGELFNPGVHNGLGAEQFGAEVVNYREYDPSEDDGLAIDPYMTALHGGEPWVCDYAPDRLRRASLIVDQRVGMLAGGKLRTAHEIAYALGYALNRQGDLAALYVSSHAQVWTDMSRGYDALDQFERLLQVTSPSEQSALSQALRLAAYNEQHQDMVFVISDLMSSDWQEALGMLANDTFGVVVVQVLHPRDVGMTDNGQYAWQGNGSIISSSSAFVRNSWSQAAQAYQAEVRALLGSREFEHIVINPTEPTVRQLIQAFTHREVYA